MTQSDIDLLITCSKNITTKRLILQTVDRSLRGGLDAESIIDQRIIKFKIFFRQSVILEEKFSVGLRFYSDDLSEEITLARYNGIHEHTNKHTNGEIFNTYHKHFATEEAILKGVKAEHNAKPADYVNFKGAIIRFFKELNFENYQKFLKPFGIIENESDNLPQLDFGS